MSRLKLVAALFQLVGADQVRAVLRVEDETGRFSQADLDELRNFIINDLLSTEIELDWLSVIKIRRVESDYLGTWKAEFHRDPQNSNEIDGIAAVIVLNYFYLKTLNALKETLAHEYGHHWTLCYLSVNQGIDIWKQRIPSQYYLLRGLDEQDYAHDYSKGWHKCDKEIIAEDYRVLFSPDPYNQKHEIVVTEPDKLTLPNEATNQYIRNLAEF